MARVASTRIRQRIDAPRERVYAALVDPEAVARWKVPAGMTCEVHEFDVREGGAVRVSLTYEAADRVGKSRDRADTYRGRFVRLVPDELVVEVDEFETDSAEMMGEMTTTISLADADGGTDLVATHDGLPEGLSLADNQAGWQQALRRLRALVESSS